MEEKMKLKGKLNIDVAHADGTLTSVHNNNTVVTLGMFQAARSIVSGAYAAPDPVSWMAIGLGSSTVAAGDTVLGSEYLRLGNADLVGSTTTTSTTNDTSRFIGSFGILDTKTVNEAGLFNKSGLDLGSMMSRTGFTDIVVVSGDTIRATWDIAFS